MTTPTIVTPAVTERPARAPDATARIRAMWTARSPIAATDSAWVPLASGAMILVVGAIGLATREPWLFAGLGPTALLLASSPQHTTARVHNVVVGHLTGLAAAWLSLLLLGAATAPALLSGQPTPVARVWASAFAVALTALVQPSLRAYHPPAAATALLLTLGVYRTSWSTSLSLLGGAFAVALIGTWLRRVRPAAPMGEPAAPRFRQ